MSVIQLSELEEQLFDLECDWEEIEECGDLEDRFDVLIKIADLKAKIDRLRRNYDASRER